MAAMYGSVVDAFHAVDRMLSEAPDERYLIWRVVAGDPWNVQKIGEAGLFITEGSLGGVHDLMVVDRALLNDLGQMILFAKFGG